MNFANQIQVGDCLEVMRGMPNDSVDLVFTSPPYEAARTYGIGFGMRGQQWVDWCIERFVECLRVCRGLVAWVVEGQTRNFEYTATPFLLVADLKRRGIKLRKPPIYQRVGIPGSGGPDWFRNDYELIVCATRNGRLPWSDNTACGQPPVYAPGGTPSHRLRNGKRVSKYPWRKHSDGIRGEKRSGAPRYKPPAKANPGNVVRCHGGGGHLGSKLAHENEAPFPEQLAERFIRSFCPPDGIVFDPFCGSGTTLAVAKKWNRNYFGVDVRESQIELSQRRLLEVAEHEPTNVV